MYGKVDPDTDEKLSQRINQLTFKKKKADEEKYGKVRLNNGTCVVKSVTVPAKMLDKALDLKERLPDLTWSPGNK